MKFISIFIFSFVVIYITLTFIEGSVQSEVHPNGKKLNNLLSVIRKKRECTNPKVTIHRSSDAPYRSVNVAPQSVSSTRKYDTRTYRTSSNSQKSRIIVFRKSATGDSSTKPCNQYPIQQTTAPPQPTYTPPAPTAPQIDYSNTVPMQQPQYYIMASEPPQTIYPMLNMQPQNYPVYYSMPNAQQQLTDPAPLIQPVVSAQQQPIYATNPMSNVHQPSYLVYPMSTAQQQPIDLALSMKPVSQQPSYINLPTTIAKQPEYKIVPINAKQ